MSHSPDTLQTPRTGPWPHRRGSTALRVAWIIVAIAFVVGAVTGLRRALKDKPDWHDLRAESRYVWQHGHTAPGTAMFGYLPTTTFALWPFTVWTPPPIGAVLFVLSNVLAGVAGIWIVRRWWLAESPPGNWFVWAVVLVSANFAHAIQANQITMWTLLLCVAGLALVERRRGLLGGGLLGLAVLIKTLPIAFALYFVLRRRWRALAGMVIAMVLFDAVPSIAFFGWTGAIAEHRAWLRRAEWHSNRRLIEEPLLRVHRHGTNSSYAAVLTRWLRDVPNAQRQVILYGDPPPEVVQETRAALAADQILTLDPMPPREGAWSEKRIDIAWVPRFHVAELSAEDVWWIWVGTLAVGLAALVWMTWKTGRGDTNEQWVPLAALWLLALFWPSPMARHYYLAWAFPAVVVVWRMLAQQLRTGRSRWNVGTLLAAAALVAWGVGVACLGWPLVRWYGIHLAAIAVLMAATAWAWKNALGTAVKILSPGDTARSRDGTDRASVRREAAS